MKKESFRAVIRRLDTLMSLYVRERDGKCITCGSVRNLENGHFISRYFLWTRFDGRNCNAQCHECNSLHESNPGAYELALIHKYGPTATLDLKRLAGNGDKMTRKHLEYIENNIREGLLRVRSNNVSEDS